MILNYARHIINPKGNVMQLCIKGNKLIESGNAMQLCKKLKWLPSSNESRID